MAASIQTAIPESPLAETAIAASAVPSAPIGVSVVVCCYNSAKVLPTTLLHLSRQICTSDLHWEVIVVDNGSTDGTANVARNTWSADCKIPFRVVCESRLGLSFARDRGITESRYEFIAFVDDDNWVAPDWVARVAATMIDHPGVGALGGSVEPAFASDFRWGDPLQFFLPISARDVDAGDVTSRPDAIIGAGMTVRRTALNQLQSRSFHVVSVGRQGTNLYGAEESELLLALRLLGWKHWRSNDLLIKHFIPDHRTEWRYLRRLAFGTGRSACALEPMFFALKPARRGFSLAIRNLRQSWASQVLLSLAEFLKSPLKAIRLSGGDREGDPEQLKMDYLRGHLAGLLAARAWYNQRSRQVHKTFSLV